MDCLLKPLLVLLFGGGMQALKEARVLPHLYGCMSENPWQHCAFGMDSCVFALLGSA